VRITRVYTRVGDGGTTRIVGGAEVPKDDPRIEAYGTVDELNAVLGVVRASLPSSGLSAADVARLDELLAVVQDDLFNVGTELAVPPDARWDGMYRVSDADVERLEQQIDALNEILPPLAEFVLPGGGPAGAHLHHARTVCRRAERRALPLTRQVPDLVSGPVRYLNRLSDLLFVAARWAVRGAGQSEVLWRNPATRDRSRTGPDQPSRKRRRSPKSE
jgi:cob(I)alamin adenosyltransferase